MLVIDWPENEIFNQRKTKDQGDINHIEIK